MSPMFGGDGVIRAGIKDATNELLFGNTGTVSKTDYVTVRVEFDNGEMKLLVDGELRSTMSTGYSIQQILQDGTSDGLCGYIGRSLYTPDPEFTGKLTQFDVYAVPVTDATKIEEDLAALDIPNADQIREDITLPTVGEAGSTIVWSSEDAEGIIDLETGAVTRPTDSDKVVHLTATLTVGELTQTKEFVLTVKMYRVLTDADRLEIPYYVTADYTLPTTVGDGAAVTWDGELTVPDSGISQCQTLTATITSQDGTSVEKTFRVYVMGADSVELLGYTRNNGAPWATVCIWLPGTATHTALNSNYGVLFAQSDFTTTVAGLPRGFTDAYLFRMEDGSFGVVAQRTLDDGSIDHPGEMLLFTSEDLIQYEEVGLIEICEGSSLNQLTCSYDSANDCYRVVWTDDDGETFCRTTTDFVSFTGQTEWFATQEQLPQVFITGAIPQTVLTVSGEEYAVIDSRLGRVYATDADDAQVELNADDETTSLEDTRVTVHYSDGSTADKRVEWDQEDLAQIDTSVPGTYTVEGTIVQNSFPFPMMVNRADPSIIYWEGMYYFIATDDYQGSQCNLYIRGSETLEGLQDTTGEVITGDYQDGWWTANSYKDANDHLLWDGIFTEGNEHYGIHWAPELHAITDSNGVAHLYCFFAMRSDTNQGRYAPQAYVAKLKDGGDPLNAEDWETPVRVQKQSGEYLSENEGITLDMTYFEVDGVSYVCWSQPKDSPAAGLYIATVNKDEPWKLTSEQVHIAWPTYRWERGIVGDDAAVNEGANVIINDGVVYMVYSGSRVGSDYATGMLMAEVGADLLDPDSWTKSNYPWMHNGVLEGQSGLGHNSFFVDEYGDLYNVYHAVGQDGRASTIVPVHFRVDGTPILDMKPEEEVPADRTVVMTVVVKEQAHVHAAVKTEAQDATCTQDGNMEYWYCQECGKYFSDEACTQEITQKDTIIPATGHTTQLEGQTEATCTEDGYTGDLVCTICGEIVEAGQVIPATGHHYEDGVCTNCGAQDPDYEEPAGVNKTLLEKTYEYALTLDTTGVVDAAVEQFEQAIKAAQAVLDNDQATQDEVNTAWDHLMEAIWSLGLKQGDKAMLNLLMERANAMMGESEKYVETNWQQLLDALTAAQNVAGDGNAMQEDVDEAAEALLNAILAQRYKADKSILEQLIVQAQDVDLTGYTAQSVATFRAALQAAQAVLADNTLSEDDQDAVDYVAQQLDAAIRGLETADGTQPSPQPTPDQEDSDVPQTGDAEQLMLYVAVLVVAMGLLCRAAVVGKRRQR